MVIRNSWKNTLGRTLFATRYNAKLRTIQHTESYCSKLQRTQNDTEKKKKKVLQGTTGYYKALQRILKISKKYFHNKNHNVSQRRQQNDIYNVPRYRHSKRTSTANIPYSKRTCTANASTQQNQHSKQQTHQHGKQQTHQHSKHPNTTRYYYNVAMYQGVQQRTLQCTTTYYARYYNVLHTRT